MTIVRDASTERNEPFSQPMQPSEMVRAVVSLFLAVYFFGMVLCIAGNSSSGSSVLVRTIKTKLFSPWLYPLWLDLGFDYHLTYGSVSDADFSISATAIQNGEVQTLEYPSADMGSLRAARWRRMAKWMATSVEDPNRESALPSSIGSGMLKQRGVDEVSIAVIRNELFEPTDSRVTNRKNIISRDDVHVETVYSARMRLVSGEPQLIKNEVRRDVAPLVNPAKTNASESPREVKP